MALLPSRAHFGIACFVRREHNRCLGEGLDQCFPRNLSGWSLK
jgi:hypothetical protein